MPFIPIADPADPRLGDYRNIPDAELLARHGIFVAEGRLVVSRLLASGRFAPRSALLTEPARRALAGDAGLQRAEAALPIYVVPPALMEPITGFNIHRGCLAIAERGMPATWQMLAERARVLVVAEAIANADNIGALFRNAAAFGADAVLLDPTCTDPLYRKAIRTSMGAALQLPFARLEPWPDALRTLRGAGWTVLALTPSAGLSVAEFADHDGPRRVVGPAEIADHNGRRRAIVVGHEGDGLSDAALALCDHHLRIPMAEGIDSLNVATAAAIALYELRR